MEIKTKRQEIVEELLDELKAVLKKGKAKFLAESSGRIENVFPKNNITPNGVNRIIPNSQEDEQGFGVMIWLTDKNEKGAHVEMMVEDKPYAMLQMSKKLVAPAFQILEQQVEAGVIPASVYNDLAIDLLKCLGSGAEVVDLNNIAGKKEITKA